MKFTITPDKLQFSFYPSSVVDNVLMRMKLDNYVVLDSNIKINNSFKIQKDIYDNGVLLGTLYLGNRTVLDYCKFSFANSLLYISVNLVKSFMLYLCELEVITDLNICSLELAIDTNYNVLRRYNNLVRDNKLKVHNNYECDYYGIEYYNDKYVKNINNETKYIINKRCNFNLVVDNNKTSLRIENKYNILNDNNKRNYIKDYLIENGVDVAKKYYRFELVIPNKECLIVSNNIVYYNNDRSDYITTHNYNKVKGYIKDFDKNNVDNQLFFGCDKEYLHYKSIMDVYTIKDTLRKKIDIDLQRLFDKDYLYNIFFFYSEKVIYNVSDIIDITYRKEKISNVNMKKVKRIKSKKEKFDYDIELAFSTLAYNLDSGVMTKREYDIFVGRILKKNNNVLDNYIGS